MVSKLIFLHLIRKKEVSIEEVRLSELTASYMEYVDMMQSINLDLAGEFLEIAAMLILIKSRHLLPRAPEDLEEIEEEDDPRAELVRRLLEYERFRTVSESINLLKRVDRDVFVSNVNSDNLAKPMELPDIDLKDLVFSFQDVLKRADMFSTLHFTKEPLSVRERMGDVLETLKNKEFVEFSSLFNLEEEKMGLVVTFLAILELMKESLIEIVPYDFVCTISINDSFISSNIARKVTTKPIFSSSKLNNELNSTNSLFLSVSRTSPILSRTERGSLVKWSVENMSALFKTS
jgi:segregation and condensation protein A